MAEIRKGAGGHPAERQKKSGEPGVRSKSPSTKPAAAAPKRKTASEPSTGAERWLFAVVGAGDVAADTIRHTATRTRTLFSGGRRGAAVSTSATVDRLAVRGRSVMGEVTGSDSVRAMSERAGSARKRFDTLSTNLGKAASNAVEAGKAFRRAS